MSLVPAIIVFVVICAAIAVQKVIFDGDMGAMFLMLWVVLIPFGMFYGFKASELEDIAVKFTAKSLPAVFIMLSVGALIGTWIAAGTTPAVIYYGIKFINPKFFPWHSGACHSRRMYLRRFFWRQNVSHVRYHHLGFLNMRSQYF